MVLLIHNNTNRSLDHPHIIKLLAYSLCETRVTTVMNYVNGRNLDVILFSKRLHDYKEVGYQVLCMLILDLFLLWLFPSF